MSEKLNAAPTYSELINNIQHVATNTTLSSKQKVIKQLGRFLVDEGYEQLGKMLIAKSAELTIKE